MFWAIVRESKLMGFEFSDTPEGAIRTYAKRARVPEEEVFFLLAIDAKKLRDDVRVPRWLIPALEHGPQSAFGPQESSPEAWRYYMRATKTLKRHGIELEDIAGWVKVSPIFDEWAPVVR
jgi:hypothetical protein